MDLGHSNRNMDNESAAEVENETEENILSELSPFFTWQAFDNKDRDNQRKRIQSHLSAKLFGPDTVGYKDAPSWAWERVAKGIETFIYYTAPSLKKYTQMAQVKNRKELTEVIVEMLTLWVRYPGLNTEERKSYYTILYLLRGGKKSLRFV